MKSEPKKELTTKKKWLLAIFAFAAAGVIIGFTFWSSSKGPTWKSAQSFQDNRFLISVDKTSRQYKHSESHFFLIHTYDFKVNAFKEVIRINIEENEDYHSEYMGYSDRYVWLTAPDWTAVDMQSPKHPVLYFSDLKKKICANNSGQFTDVIELAKVEDYLIATNQNGDQFFVNLETFATTQKRPEPYYDAYHKEYSILSELPKFIPGSQYAENFYCVAAVGKTDYTLKPIDETNSFKRTFFSSPNNGPEQISVTAADSTQVAILNGKEIIAVQQAETIAPKETRLTNLSYINAVGLGVSNNRFVFRYQKTVDISSPWYLAWFDLTTKKVIKEVNLETRGLKIESPMEFLSHWVSIDGKWAFFAIENKVPVRIKLRM